MPNGVFATNVDQIEILNLVKLFIIVKKKTEKIGNFLKCKNKIQIEKRLKLKQQEIRKRKIERQKAKRETSH